MYEDIITKIFFFNNKKFQCYFKYFIIIIGKNRFYSILIDLISRDFDFEIEISRNKKIVIEVGLYFLNDCRSLILSYIL